MIKSKKIVFKYSNIILLLIALLFFLNTYQISILNYVHPISTYYFLIVLLLILLPALKFNKILSLKKLSPFVICLLVGMLSFVKSRSLIILQITIICFATIKIDFRRIIKTYIGCIAISIIALWLLDYSGMLPHYSFARIGIANSGERMAFGFAHPNFFSLYLLALNFALYFIDHYSHKILRLTLLAVSFFITYKYSQSQTVAVILLAFLIYYLVSIIILPMQNFLSRFSWIIKLLFCIGMPILIYFVFKISSSRSSLDFFVNLGVTANARIYYANRALRTYGISLFGQKITMYGTMYFNQHTLTDVSKFFTIDCLYVLLAVRDGILASIVFWAIYFISFLKLYKIKEYGCLVVLFLLLVYSIMESGLSYFAMFFIFIRAFSNKGYSIEPGDKPANKKSLYKVRK